MKVEKETPAQLRRRRELGIWIQSHVEAEVFQRILAKPPDEILEEWEIQFLEESGVVGELATRRREQQLAARP